MATVMTDMEMTDDDKADMTLPSPMPDRPDYPWGLRISLCEKELEKLGLPMPEAEEVGGMIHGHFMAKITSVSSSAGENDSSCRVELQITHLAVESEDEENEEADAPPAKARRSLYG